MPDESLQKLDEPIDLERMTRDFAYFVEVTSGKKMTPAERVVAKFFAFTVSPKAREAIGKFMMLRPRKVIKHREDD